MLELKSQANHVFELTPEYYSDPSFLLGNKQRDPVGLPRFSSDPFAFIATQRKMLEAPETSCWLPKWLDWVFGCDSRSTELAWNSTVESTVRNTSRELADALHLKLFQDPHPSRPRVEELEKSSSSLLGRGRRFTIYQPTSEDFESLTYFVHVCCNPLSDELALFGPAFVTVLSKQPSANSEDPGQLARGLSVVDESPLNPTDVSRLCKPFVCDWAKLRLIGALKSSVGSLGIVDPSKDSLEELHCGTAAVSALALDPVSRLLYVGTHDGLLLAYCLAREQPSLLFSTVLGALPVLDRVASTHQVSSIELHPSECVLLLAQANNLLTLLNSHTGVPVCSIKLPKRLHKVPSAHQAVLSLSPTPLVCAYSSEDSSLSVYSLTGQFLTEKKLKDTVVKMLISKDAAANASLILLSENSSLSFLTLPSLEDARKKLQLPSRFKASDLLLTHDRASLVAVDRRDLLICQSEKTSY